MTVIIDKLSMDIGPIVWPMSSIRGYGLHRGMHRLHHRRRHGVKNGNEVNTLSGCMSLKSPATPVYGPVCLHAGMRRSVADGKSGMIVT